jgi:hypothetical protein
VLLFAVPFAFLFVRSLGTAVPGTSRERLALVAAGTLLVPHLLATMLTIYSEPSALALAQGAVLAWLVAVSREGRGFPWLLVVSFLLAGAAVLSRQFYLFLVPALLWPLWRLGRWRVAGPLAGAAALLPAALLFLLWRGVTPAHGPYREIYALDWTAGNLFQMTALLGAYAWPVLWALRPPRLALWAAVPAALLGALLLGAQLPDGPWRKTLDAAASLASRLLHPAVGGSGKALAVFLLLSVGFTVVLTCATRLRSRDPLVLLFSAATVLFVLGMLVAGSRTYERYVLPVVPLAALLFAREKVPRLVLVLWAGQMAVTAVPLVLRWTGHF